MQDNQIVSKGFKLYFYDYSDDYYIYCKNHLKRALIFEKIKLIEIRQ